MAQFLIWQPLQELFPYYHVLGVRVSFLFSTEHLPLVCFTHSDESHSVTTKQNCLLVELAARL